MSEQSLSKYKSEAKEKTEKTESSVKLLDQTQREGVVTAQMAGAVRSELSDINAEIRRLRGGVLNSIEGAVTADAKQVNDRVADTTAHQKTVDGAQDRTVNEAKKANAIRPKDARMTGGGEMSGALEKAAAELREVSRKESSVTHAAEQSSRELQARVKAAIERNR